MTTPTPNADVEFSFSPLYEVFHSNRYYRVGEYQRGFSWGEEQFEQLITDFLDSYLQRKQDTYLLGQIIVCDAREKNGNVKNFVEQVDLIDGQQRSTSLLILFLSIRKILISRLTNENEEFDASELGDFWGELNTLVRIQLLNKEVVPRVKPAENGEDFLLAILRDEVLPDPTNKTQQNISLAWGYFIDKIEQAFPAPDIDKLVDFAEYLMHKVYMVVVVVPNAARAVSIFQKVNNRGLALDESDLIKSFLFLGANPEEFSNYSTSWDNASRNVFECRLKRTQSMEFLIKLMIGITTGTSISTSRLYEEWQKLLTYPAADPKHYPVAKFASDLETKSKYLQHVSKGLYPDGSPGDLNTGKGLFELKSVQQYEIQIAGSHLSNKSYLHLLGLVEDRTLLSLWSGELPQEFERIIHPWAKAISTLDREASPKEIQAASVQAFSVNSFDTLFKKATTEIENWDYSVQSHVQKIRYLLARIYCVAERAVLEEISISDCMKTSRYRQKQLIEQGFDIDHVLPESRPDGWRQDTKLDTSLGADSRFATKVHSLGNLILLHSSDNRSQGNLLPWEEDKKRNLGQSKFILNNFLVDDHYHGKLNDRKEGPVAKWRMGYDHQAQKWDEESIAARLALYLHLLKQDFSRNLEF